MTTNLQKKTTEVARLRPVNFTACKLHLPKAIFFLMAHQREWDLGPSVSAEPERKSPASETFLPSGLVSSNKFTQRVSEPQAEGSPGQTRPGSGSRRWVPVTVPGTKPRVWTPPSRDVWAGSGRWRQFARLLETDYWTGRHWARHRGWSGTVPTWPRPPRSDSPVGSGRAVYCPVRIHPGTINQASQKQQQTEKELRRRTKSKRRME